jgi:hypothetical protein
MMQAAKVLVPAAQRLLVLGWAERRGDELVIDVLLWMGWW